MNKNSEKNAIIPLVIIVLFQLVAALFIYAISKVLEWAM